MSNTNKSIEHGYGYRLLKDGEPIKEGDECLPPGGKWVDRLSHGYYGVGSAYRDPSKHKAGHYLTRRKIDVGAGYRLVGENETILATDECAYARLVDGSNTWYSCERSEGSTPKQEHSDFWAKDHVVIRRKVETAVPVSPRTPEGTPPAGYRFLVEGEVIQEGDCWLSSMRGQLIPANDDRGNYVGSKVGERNCDLSVCPFVRPVGFAKSSAPSQAEELLKAELKVAKAAIDGLKSELKRANDHSEALRKTIDANVKVADGLRRTTYDLLVKNHTLREQLGQMQKNASGNIVLVRRNGFSKPVQYSSATNAEVQGWVEYGALFMATGKKDGFGRAIFEQQAP